LPVLENFILAVLIPISLSSCSFCLLTYSKLSWATSDTHHCLQLADIKKAVLLNILWP